MGIKKLFFGAIGIMLLLFFSIFVITYAYLDDSFPQRQKYVSKTHFPPYNADTLQIEDIAWNVSNSRHYEKYTYDCTQFSEELVNQLQALNYSAECVTGVVEHNNSMDMHTWVEVTIDNETIPIEATSGFVINQGVYYGHYQILSKGYCL